MWITNDGWLLLGVMASVLMLALTITIGNERVRRATQRLGDVAREWALAELAMKRAAHRQTLHVSAVNDATRLLRQIALDVSGETLEFSAVELGAVEDGLCLIARTANGHTACFVPVARRFLAGVPAARRRHQKTYAIHALRSAPLVIEEIEAVARLFGVSALPRTEQWELVLLPPPDASALVSDGWAGWLHSLRSLRSRLGG